MREKYYFVSAPYEEPHSGDSDYVHALMDGLGTDVEKEYLTGAVCGYIPRAIESVEKLCATRNDVWTFSCALFECLNDPARKEVVGKIKEAIRTRTPDEVRPRLMLQLRPPETGAMFMPEDLLDFRLSGIAVTITCHEYKLNYGRRYLQAYAQQFFMAADQVVFFSDKDRNNAMEHASRVAILPPQFIAGRTARSHAKITDEHGLFCYDSYDLGAKSLLSRVPPTVRYEDVEFDRWRESPPNIIVFGLIRECKGFDLALAIAETLRQKSSTSRVLIVGKPFSNRLVAQILNTQSQSIVSCQAACLALPDLVKQLRKRVQATASSDGDYMASLPELKQGGKARALSDKMMWLPKVAEFTALQLAIRDVERDDTDKAKVLRLVGSLRAAVTAISVEEGFCIAKHAEVVGVVDTAKAEITAQIDTILRFATSVITPEDAKHRMQTRGFDDLALTGGTYPLDVYFDVPAARMPEMFRRARYAVKIDEKGWANNASALINAAANGCILYADWGMCTSDDVLPARTKRRVTIPEGKYCGAVVLPPHKYSQHGASTSVVRVYDAAQERKRAHATMGSLDRVAWILKDIEEKESDLERTRVVFDKAQSMIATEFAASVVAAKLRTDLDSRECRSPTTEAAEVQKFSRRVVEIVHIAEGDRAAVSREIAAQFKGGRGRVSDHRHVPAVETGPVAEGAALAPDAGAGPLPPLVPPSLGSGTELPLSSPPSSGPPRGTPPPLPGESTRRGRAKHRWAPDGPWIPSGTSESHNLYAVERTKRRNAMSTPPPQQL